jgi:hypothetical protein
VNPMEELCCPECLVLQRKLSVDILILGGMKMLERFIVGLLAMFVLLVLAVAVGGTAQAWAMRDRAHNSAPVSKAEVVSMQPYAGKPPVILVMGPTGSEIKVSGTEGLKQPYPAEGDYIDVVFPRTGGAVIPPLNPSNDTALATILIIAIWLGWCAILLSCVKVGRVLINTITRWQPKTPRRRTTRPQHTHPHQKTPQP